jgi:hypothetical protein
MQIYNIVTALMISGTDFFETFGVLWPEAFAEVETSLFTFSINLKTESFFTSNLIPKVLSELGFFAIFWLVQDYSGWIF